MIKTKNIQLCQIKENSFKKCCNKVVDLIKINRKSHYQKFFEGNKRNSKAIWQEIYNIYDKINFTYFNKEYKSKLTFQYPDGPVCTSHNIPSCVSFQYPVRSSLSNVSFLYLQYDSIV